MAPLKKFRSEHPREFKAAPLGRDEPINESARVGRASSLECTIR